MFNIQKLLLLTYLLTFTSVSSYGARHESYNTADNLFDRINMRDLLKGEQGGSGITVAVLDNGVNFDSVLLQGKDLLGGGEWTPYQRRVKRGGTIKDYRKEGDCFEGQFSRPEKFYLAPSYSHGTEVALILAGNTWKEESRIGVSPGISIVPYSSQWSSVFPSLLLGPQIHIANYSGSGLKLKHLNLSLSIPKASGKKIRSIAIVASAGDDLSFKNQPTTMSENHPDGKDSKFGNIIVTVAIDENNQLTPFSSSCGNARRFCVAVPSPDFPAKGAPVISGLLALLMEQFPGLSASTYVDAVLRSASSSHAPSWTTGMGVPNAKRAALYLETLTAEVAFKKQKTDN